MATPELESFGRYALLKRLAFGGMAEIFLAALRSDEGFEKRVVLKRILPQFSADSGFVSMFIDEAKLAARLSHPNIVQVYDFGAVDGIYFIAMEHIDGADLRQILKWSAEARSPLTVAEVAAIGEEIARGLHYAHALTDPEGRAIGIVHRDVSPANIMVSRTGVARLMDFGIAKAADRATRTATGTIKGKVAYMAPEQAAGRELDGRADQFALGLVLWEALAGERMFQAGSDLELLQAVVECRVRPLLSVRPDVPGALSAIIARSLAHDPEDRYLTLELMARELAAYRFALGTEGVVQLGDLVQRSAPTAPVEAPRQTLSLADDDSPSSERTAATRDLRGPNGAGSRPDDDGERLLARDATLVGSRPGPVPSTAVPPAAGSATSRGKRWPLVAAVAVCAVLVGGMARLMRERGQHPPRSQVQVMAPQTVPLVVNSTPAGAALFLDGRSTGLTTPAVLPRLEVGGQVTVELRFAGHLPWRSDLVMQPAGNAVDAGLVPAEVFAGDGHEPGASRGERVVDAAPADGAASTAPVASKRKPAKKGGAVHPGVAPRATAARAGEARLWLRSSGTWVDVYLGSQKLGTTPLSGVSVPAGRLELRLVNAEQGIDRGWVVEVGKGEEARRTVAP